MKTAPKVRGPRDVPDLRTYLVDGWKTTYKYALETVGQDNTGNFWAEQGLTRDAADWESRTLRHPSYWWVTADMVDLLAAAEKSLPDETILEPELVPQPSGLVVFAKPLTGLDAKVNAHQLLVHAILWGPVRLPPWPGYNEGFEMALGMSSYQQLHGSDGLTAEQLAMAATTGALTRSIDDLTPGEQLSVGDLWVPMGRSDWVYGKPANHRHMPAEDFTMTSIIEDRKRVATMWLLQAEEGITETDVSEGNRGERRRAEREGAPRPTVRVVDINRRPSRHGREDDGERRHLTVRSLTDSYWRKRPYHPSCADCQRLRRGCGNHRPKFIHAFWRGPEDAPVSQTKKVRIWK